jgi:lipopolysaccharide biosynthesis glycosyltransferase
LSVAGLVVAMRSILENSLSPETVYFHVVVVGETADSLREFLSCHGIYLQDQLDVQMLDELQLVQHKIKVHASPQVVGNLASKANFARFYFHKIFTRLRKALYVDSDVVVQQDIGQLWQIAMKSDAVFAAVKRSVLNIQYLNIICMLVTVAEYQEISTLWTVLR